MRCLTDLQFARRFLVVLVASMIAVAGYASSTLAQDSSKVTSPAPSSHPNISGHWKLNIDKSKEMNGPGERRGGFGGGGDMGRGPGGGMGGMRGGPGGGMGGGRRGGDRRGAIEEISITQTDSTVTISNKNGRDRVLFIDARLMHVQFDSGAGMDMRAYWNGDAELVVEHINPERGSMKEFYSVSTDGSKLTVVMQNPLGVEHSRVYSKVH